MPRCSIAPVDETSSKAPVNAHAEVDIDADVREVWAIVADVDAWPTWNPTVREATSGGELEVGARFRFSTELGSFGCRFVEVDAPRLLAWRGRILSLSQGQRWQLEQRPDGTHAAVAATMSGLSARLFRRRYSRRLSGELDALVRLLKLEAEARAADRRLDAAGTTENRPTELTNG